MNSAAVKLERVVAPNGAAATATASPRWRMPLLADLVVCASILAIGLQHYGLGERARLLILAQAVAAAISVGLMAIFGSYRRATINTREVCGLTASTVIGFVIADLLAGLVASGQAALASSFFIWKLFLACLLLARLGRYYFTDDRIEPEPLPVVILGAAKNAKQLYSTLQSDSTPAHRRGSELQIAAIFADGLEEWPEDSRGDLVVSETKWAKSFSEFCRIDCGIIAVPAECDPETVELVKKSAGIFKSLLLAPQIATGQRVFPVVRGKNLELQVSQCAAASEAHFLKRVVDAGGALLLGLLSLPFVLLVAIAIRLTSRGPILYKQLRIGRGNRLFLALKFRTMFVDSGDRLNHYLDRDPALRAQWESVHKLKEDPRVTSIGRLLRRFSLDELPQIWNVLVGDMSLIGPRPIVVTEIEKYGLDYAFYEAVRPGLTGLWQVSGRNDTTYEERVGYDSYYVRNWSPWLDARIVARTFRAVISGKGAY